MRQTAATCTGTRWKPGDGTTGNVEALALYAGQGAGLADGILPAADIVGELTRDVARVSDGFRPRLGSTGA